MSYRVHITCMWAVMLEGGGVWGHCITLCFNIRRGETTGGFNEMFGIFPGMFVKKKKKKKKNIFPRHNGTISTALSQNRKLNIKRRKVETLRRSGYLNKFWTYLWFSEIYIGIIYSRFWIVRNHVRGNSGWNISDITGRIGRWMLLNRSLDISLQSG